MGMRVKEVCGIRLVMGCSCNKERFHGFVKWLKQLKVKADEEKR